MVPYITLFLCLGQFGAPKWPTQSTTDYMAAFVGGRSRRKSAVQNNTESRFSSWVIKRIGKKDPKKSPEKNTSFVVFYAIFGLQTGPQNVPNDQKTPFQRLLTAQKCCRKQYRIKIFVFSDQKDPTKRIQNMVPWITLLLVIFRLIFGSKMAHTINDLILWRPSWVVAHGAKVL